MDALKEKHDKSLKSKSSLVQLWSHLKSILLQRFCKAGKRLIPCSGLCYQCKICCGSWYVATPNLNTSSFTGFIRKGPRSSRSQSPAVDWFLVALPKKGLWRSVRKHWRDHDHF